MFSAIKTYWKKARSNRITSLLIDLAIVLPVLFGVMAWQERNMLPANGSMDAPHLELTGLDGRQYALRDYQGRQVLLYFFAPWCGVCHASVENVEQIRRKKDSSDLAVFFIALDWADPGSVVDFTRRHDLTAPVLLGNAAVKQQYKVDAYPSYYVLDEEGQVVARSRGYSTEIGMRLRL
jgi:peroxiredoxin